MRNFFLLVLLINLGFFLWSYQKSGELKSSEETNSAAVATLTLVSELPSASLQEQQLLALSTYENKQQQITEAETEAETEIREANEPISLVEAEQQSNAQEKSQMPGLRLDTTETAPSAFFCFKTKATQLENPRSEVEKTLLANDVQVEREETVLDVRVGYWVIIPPASDRKAALEMVQRLKEQGVTDVRRFTKGELVNAISLGLFRKKEYADRRGDIVKEKGFETKIKLRMRSKQGYILHIKSNDKMFPDSDLWLGISTDKANYQLQREPCISE